MVPDVLAGRRRARDPGLDHGDPARLVGDRRIGVVIALRHGRQTPASLGWRRRDLAPALLVLVAAWLLREAAAGWAHGGPVPPAAAVAEGRWGHLLGPLLAQLAGTALMEETLYRAFLWPQLRLRLVAVLPARSASVLALIASQAIFALMHIPIRIYQGAALADLGGMLAMLFASGIVLALVYAATRNLFIAVAIHALANAPTCTSKRPGRCPARCCWRCAACSAWRPAADAGCALPVHRSGRRSRSHVECRRRLSAAMRRVRVRHLLRGQRRGRIAGRQRFAEAAQAGGDVRRILERAEAAPFVARRDRAADRAYSPSGRAH